MPTLTSALTHCSDSDLLVEVARLAANERHATAALVAALAELDTRRLYLGEGCASLFTYCTERLHLSEHAAYRRIEAARLARRFPLILSRLEAGEVTLTALGLVAPHLTEENHRAVLDAARHQGKRAVEELVAQLHPRPDVPASVRKLPGPRALAPERRPTPSAMAADRVAPPNADAPSAPLLSAEPAPASVVAAPPPPSPRRPAIIRPLAPARYQVQLTVSAETHAKLRRAQDLLRHAIPDGDPAAVVDRALTVLLVHLERTKCAALPLEAPKREAAVGRPRRRKNAVARPRPKGAEMSRSRNAARNPPERLEAAPHSRAIPAAVRREVWARDGGQCAFIGTAGRCRERGALEFHHLVPFAAGGPATVGNVALRCRRHNQHEAVEYFGTDVAKPAASAPQSGPTESQTRSGPSFGHVRSPTDSSSASVAT